MPRNETATIAEPTGQVTTDGPEGVLEDSTGYTVRFPQPLYRRLKEHADRERRSVNAQVLHFVEEGLPPAAGNGDGAA